MSKKEAALEFKSQGNTAFQAGEFDRAVELFSKAIENDPSDHVLYSNRSAAYASKQVYEKALEDAEHCIRLKSDWAKGYSRKGLALSHLGRTAEAIECYEQGLKYDPSNAALTDGLNRAKMSGTRNVLAEQLEMQIMIKLGQDKKFIDYMVEDPDYIKRLAGIVSEIGLNAAGDAQKLRLAMAVSPQKIKEGLATLFGIEMPTSESPAEPSTAGESAPGGKEPEAAKSAHNDGLTAEQREAEDLKAQGNAAYKEKNFEEALRLYDEAFAKNPSEMLYLNNKAAVYLEMGQYDKCLETCQKALDECPREGATSFAKVAKVYSRMAACYLKQKQFEDAIKYYKRALCEDNDRHIRAALREAERAWDKEKTESYINPALAEEARMKGNEFFKEHNYPAAKECYDEAVKRNPKDARCYGNRAAVYMQLLEYPSALKDAEKALELDPKFVKAWARKGTCHLRMRELNKALSAYQEGLKIDPDNDECRNGYTQTIMMVRQQQTSKDVDEDQVKKALADPEIQNILRDPQFQMVLEQLQEDPSRLQTLSREPKIAEGLQKLIVAGILKTA